MASQGTAYRPGAVTPLPVDPNRVVEHDNKPRAGLPTGSAAAPREADPNASAPRDGKRYAYYPPKRFVHVVHSYNGLAGFSVSATLRAAGEIRAAGQQIDGQATLRSGASVFANAQNRRISTAGPTLGVTLRASGGSLFNGAMAASSGFRLTATATGFLQTGVANLHAGARLTASSREVGVAATRAGVTLTATGTVQRNAQVALHATSTLTAKGSADTAAAAIGFGATLTATGQKRRLGTAPLFVSTRLAGAGAREAIGTAALHLAVALHADNRVLGAAALHVSTGLAASPVFSWNGAAVLRAGFSFINISGRVVGTPNADLGSGFTLRAWQTHYGAAALTCHAAMAAGPGQIRSVGTARATIGVAVTADGHAQRLGQARLSMLASLAATALHQSVAQAQLEIGTRLTGAAAGDNHGEAMLASSLRLIATTGITIVNGAAHLSSAARLAGSGIAVVHAEGYLASAVTIAADARPRHIGRASIAVAAQLHAADVMITHVASAALATRTRIGALAGGGTVQGSATLLLFTEIRAVGIVPGAPNPSLARTPRIQVWTSKAATIASQDIR